MFNPIRDRWAGLPTRSDTADANNLGIVSLTQERSKKFRRQCLEKFDSYYENRQYDGMVDWDKGNREGADYVPVRERSPRIKLRLAQTFCQRVAGRIAGEKTFPLFQIEDDPDAQQFLGLVLKMVDLRGSLVEPLRRMMAAGSVFVRMYAVVDEQTGQAAMKLEHYLSKYCYPEFDELGKLSAMRIQYVYEDPTEKDFKGNPIKRWFRLDLGLLTDIEYDNPLFTPEQMAEPIFQVVDVAEHNLGFVQGEWLRTGKDKYVPDGPSLVADAIDMIDEMNYSLSQSSQAIAYNQDPQLTLKGLDTDEVDDLVRSSSKAWNMGREGEGAFLEAGMNGVTAAQEFRSTVRLAFQDVTRVSLHDPEKLNGNILSGRAMEILNGPFVELIDELRSQVAAPLVALATKICVVVLRLMQEGADFGLFVPAGWLPQSLNITLGWPAVFPPTLEDIQKKVSLVLSTTNGNLLSRETGLRWIAKDFGVEDIEAELAKIAAQPVINPFGGF